MKVLPSLPILAGALLAACSSSSNPAPPQAVPGDPGDLPLLGDQRIHLYVQEAYEGFSPAITGAVEGRYDELVAAGMDTARHLFDWADLEPSPGVYDTDLVIDAMTLRQAAGITAQFCNLVVLDSQDLTVPDYIRDLIDMGAAWDDPLITGAFTRLLDAVVPIMLDHDMYLLGLSNEPGGYFEDSPAGAASFDEFVSAAVAHAHSIEPELSCTLVFAGTDDPALPALMPHLDVASFNYYFYAPETDPSCLLGGTLALPLFRSIVASQVSGILDDMIAGSMGKLICIQEIGQSTGWNDMPQTLGPNAGLAAQEACFLALRDGLQARAQHFRTVCVWTLNDHTPAGIAYVGDALLADGFPQCYVDNLNEIFGPTGLVRSDTLASVKPAFAAFRGAVTFFAQ